MVQAPFLEVLKRSDDIFQLLLGSLQVMVYMLHIYLSKKTSRNNAITGMKGRCPPCYSGPLVQMGLTLTGFLPCPAVTFSPYQITYD